MQKLSDPHPSSIHPNIKKDAPHEKEHWTRNEKYERKPQAHHKGREGEAKRAADRPALGKTRDENKAKEKLLGLCLHINWCTLGLHDSARLAAILHWHGWGMSKPAVPGIRIDWAPIRCMALLLAKIAPFGSHWGGRGDLDNYYLWL